MYVVSCRTSIFCKQTVSRQQFSTLSIAAIRNVHRRISREQIDHAFRVGSSVFSVKAGTLETFRTHYIRECGSTLYVGLTVIVQNLIQKSTGIGPSI